MYKNPFILINKVKLAFKETNLLLNYFSNPNDIFKAKKEDFLRAGLKEKSANNIISMLNSYEIDEEMRLIDKEEIEVVDWFSEDYPPLLKEIPFPPLVLYVKGDKKLLSKMCIAIVGSRLASLYGIQMAEKFSYSLASLGLVVVSGLARGIDTSAHNAALKSGFTIAVLGSGLLNIYPRQNYNLAKEIFRKGAVISEFSLREPPLKENFPRRNRIISGLSKGVLIVEAAKKSGALITARLALEQNREVFAVPGKADSPLSKGVHFLIKEGAKLVDSLDDILGELNIKWDKEETTVNLTSEEKVVFDIISKEGMFLEEIILKSGLDYKSAHRAILYLQVKGLIEEKKPLYFARSVYG